MSLTVQFWGVRGGYPMPGASTARIGGNTPCILVRAGGRRIILDAGTGIIQLGQYLLHELCPQEDAHHITMLWSHLHQDHMQGFPFFTPLHLNHCHIHAFIPSFYEGDPESHLAAWLSPPNFPISYHELHARRVVQAFFENSEVWIQADGTTKVVAAQEATAVPEDVVRVRALRSYAHPSGTFFYRIEWQGQAMVYATDTEGYVDTDQRLVNFARGADLLIHDAQYLSAHYRGKLAPYSTTQGFGHSTPSMAASVAQEAGVGQLALFHFDPSYNDDQVEQLVSEARVIFPNTVAACETMRLRLSSQPLAEATAAPGAEIEAEPDEPERGCDPIDTEELEAVVVPPS